MSRRAVLTVVAFCIFAGAVRAQVATPRAAQVPVAREYQDMATAMAAAQAAAIKPGDEALQCPALERELVATMNEPAIQAYAARAGAASGVDVAALKKSGMTVQAATMIASMAMAGATTPAIPGVASPPGPASQTAQQAQMAQLMAIQQAAAAGQPLSPQQQQALQQTMLSQQKIAAQQMAAVMPIMPQMMRSQRVIGLAAMKGCPWTTGGIGMAPPVAPKR